MLPAKIISCSSSHLLESRQRLCEQHAAERQTNVVAAVARVAEETAAAMQILVSQTHFGSK